MSDPRRPFPDPRRPPAASAGASTAHPASATARGVARTARAARRAREAAAAARVARAVIRAFLVADAGALAFFLLGLLDLGAGLVAVAAFIGWVVALALVWYGRDAIRPPATRMAIAAVLGGWSIAGGDPGRLGVRAWSRAACWGRWTTWRSATAIVALLCVAVGGRRGGTAGALSAVRGRGERAGRSAARGQRWRRSGRGARRSPWSGWAEAARRASSRRAWSSGSSGIERREPCARWAWRTPAASSAWRGSAAGRAGLGGVRIGVRSPRGAVARRRAPRPCPAPPRPPRSRRGTASPGARRRPGSSAGRPSSGPRPRGRRPPPRRASSAGRARSPSACPPSARRGGSGPSIPQAVARRSSESWSQVWSAVSDGAASRRSPSAISWRVRRISSSRVIGGQSRPARAAVGFGDGPPRAPRHRLVRLARGAPCLARADTTRPRRSSGSACARRHPACRRVTWDEVVDEVLCVGWIDSVRMPGRRRLVHPDHAAASPARVWSARNVGRVEALRAEGRMLPAGEAAFALRREDRTAIYSFEREAALDDEADAAIRAARRLGVLRGAAADVPAGSARTGSMSAKRPETRAKRLGGARRAACAVRGSAWRSSRRGRGAEGLRRGRPLSRAEHRLAVGAGAQRPRAGHAVADGVAVEPGDRQDPGDRRRHERLVAAASSSGVSQPSTGRRPTRPPSAGARSASCRAGSRSRAPASPAPRRRRARVRTRKMFAVVASDRWPDIVRKTRVVGAGPARLDPRVDVVRAGRRLERDDRVGRVAPDGRRDERQAALEVVRPAPGSRARPG